MSKFTKGDSVRVTAIEHDKFDQVGVVLYSQRANRSWKYGVQFSVGTFAIWEHELTLADPDVHEVLAEMAEQSGLDKEDALPQADLGPHFAAIKKSQAEWDAMVTPDPVSAPPHYTSHPSGVECIQITEHMGFNLGNALKYIWRCDLKLDAIEDLEKARWYIDRELAKRKAAQ